MSKTAQRPFVKTLLSNYKHPTGKAWKIELDRRTVIVGDNGSGKSTIPEALSFALTGAVDGLQGRNAVRDGRRLLTAVQGGELFAEATTGTDSDSTPGRTYLRRLLAEDDRVGKAQGDDVLPNVFPMRLVSDALSGSADKAYEALFALLQPKLRPDDVLGHVPSHLHGLYQDISDAKRKVRKTEALVLLDVLEYAGKRGREEAAEAKAAESFRATLLNGLEPALGAEAMEQLTAAAIGSLNNSAGPLDSSEFNFLAVNWLAGRLSSLDAQIAEAEFTLNDLLDQIGGEEQYNALTVSGVDDPATDELMNGHHQWMAHLELLRAAHQWVTTQRTALAAEMQAEAQGAPIEPAGVNHALLNQLIEARATRRLWAKVQDAAARASAANTNAERYKELVKALREALFTLMTPEIIKLEGSMTDFLPKGWEVKVQVEHRGSRALDFGLVVNGRFHAALSGGQEVALRAALALSVAAPDELVVLTTPDADLSGETLSKLMRAWQRFDGQIILTSTSTPKGWHKGNRSWTIRGPLNWETETVVGLTTAVEPEAPAPTPAPEVVEAPAPEAPVVEAVPAVVVPDPTPVRTGWPVPPRPPAPPAKALLTPEFQEYLKPYGVGPDEFARLSLDGAMTLITKKLNVSAVRINDDGSVSLLETE